VKTFIAFWLACSILSFGVINGHWRNFANCEVSILNYSQRDYAGAIAAVTALGPSGLAGSLLATNFAQHGLDYTWGWKHGPCEAQP
jgi:hypothetical protein